MDKNNKVLPLTRFIDWVYELVSGLLNFFKYLSLFLYYKISDKEDKNPKIISFGKNTYTINENQIKEHKSKLLEHSKYLIETPVKLFLVVVIFYLVYHFSLKDIVKLFIK